MPPPTRVHKVILCVSEQTAPGPPAALPVPPPPPPLEVHRPPQTPPLPPLQPPNLLPSDTGFTIPNNSQCSVGTLGNVPPTYAPLHGGMFYPPVPVYPQHQPPFPLYSALSAVPQPWNYIQYTPEQVVELGRHFPVHPLATKHATAGDEDSRASEARSRVTNGPVDENLPSQGRGCTRVGGGASANVTAPSSADGAPQGRFYPNKEVQVGAGGKCHSHLRAVKLLADCLKSGNSRLRWLMTTSSRCLPLRPTGHGVGSQMKHTVTLLRLVVRCHWGSGLAERQACGHAFNPRKSGPRHLSNCGRILGQQSQLQCRCKSRTWSVMQHITKKECRLTCEHSQHDSARRKASKVQCSKGKGKRSCEDDIPPEPTPEMAKCNGYLQELKQHLLCQTHSKPGRLTYCTIDQGGHDPLTHKDMTYWASEIVSSKTEQT
jgi:hypothetical protein